MHELTLATSLVDLASRHAREHGADRVTRITVRLGALCGIARSLYFCFKPAARRTVCADAVLQIIEIPLSVHCSHCNETKRPRALYQFRCPDCGNPTPKVLTGREMELVSIELGASERSHGAMPSAECAPTTDTTAGPKFNNDKGADMGMGADR